MPFNKLAIGAAEAIVAFGIAVLFVADPAHAGAVALAAILLKHVGQHAMSPAPARRRTHE
ncbi:hypothetical protein E6W36_10570 [Hankyongella ginsenosidimutans]|uniref:Uncharacterized protein n=1 Tax=Hankyongella ginsenosidimutans TaxID=1763828 RepID=A0A4D7CBL6_9SPHN|nr:hypothetical protein [Hankyongella ginsenosidimutans]QCI79816.1 hypothetical protein E6W36_10570 [Hankyongella ginsenosidimutans]TXG84482.1 MAG: hypothetical protein E6R12_04035 [Sphingomonadales bacterium]